MIQQAEMRDAFLARTGPLSDMALRDGIQAMIDFYLTTVAAGAAPPDEDGDMLLFECGTFDWGLGPAFQIAITRQIIYPDGEDQDIWQLRLVCRFDAASADDPPERLALWCMHRDEIPAFRASVLESEALRWSADAKPASFDVRWGHV